MTSVAIAENSRRSDSRSRTSAQHANVVKLFTFEDSLTPRNNNQRVRSTSCMTAATALDSDSLTDDDGENPRQQEEPIPKGCGDADDADDQQSPHLVCRVEQIAEESNDEETDQGAPAVPPAQGASAPVKEERGDSSQSQSVTPEQSPSPPPSSSSSSDCQEEKEEMRAEEEERRTEDANASKSMKPASSGAHAVVPKRRGSIIKPADMEIPVKNRGWKNLPKADLSKIARPVVARRAVSCPTLKRQVSFRHVEIRCYDQCVGDNPAVSYGTPIQLDWHYEEMAPLDLDAYERERGVRRNPRQMMMNYFNRRHVLTYRCGVTEEDLVSAERAANRIRAQRAVTRALLPAAIVEDLFTSGVRKTKRALLLHKSKSTPNLAAAAAEAAAAEAAALAAAGAAAAGSAAAVPAALAAVSAEADTYSA